MFYYLFYNSSFEFISLNRLFYSVIYGSILYIFCHAILNYCNIEFLQIIKNYFWIIFTLDIISITWTIYNLLYDTSNHNYYNNITNNNPIINPADNNDPRNSNNLNVSFNLLKNKINTLFDKNNNNIPNNTNFTNQPIRIIHNTNTGNITLPHNGNTTLPHNGNIILPHNGNIQRDKNILSTPISLIRETISIPDMQNITISEKDKECNESIAGSDIGNIMDLDDFEKNL